MRKIEILDSTLRDGAQGEGIIYSVQDKIHICQALDKLGVHYIEAGNPGSNPKDFEFSRKYRRFILKMQKFVHLVQLAVRKLYVNMIQIFRVCLLQELNMLCFLVNLGYSR